MLINGKHPEITRRMHSTADLRLLTPTKKVHRAQNSQRRIISLRRSTQREIAFKKNYLAA